MRARSAFFAGAGSVAILAIGWQAGVGALVSTLPTSTPAVAGTPGTALTPADSGEGSNAITSATGATAVAAGSGASGAVDGTYDGPAVSTRYGPGQVQVVISGGSISDVVVLQRQTADRKSEQISSRAVPMLREAVLAAQSANVANVSGATYTTQSYLQSLQSALDAAGFTG